MDVASMIEQGRKSIDQGDLKKAATELTDAAIATRDVEQAREIRQLADRGMELSGRLRQVALEGSRAPRRPSSDSASASDRTPIPAHPEGHTRVRS